MAREGFQKQKGIFGKRKESEVEQAQDFGRMCSYLVFEDCVKGSVLQARERNYALICLCVSNLEFVNNIFGLTNGNAAVELLGQMIENQLTSGQFATSFATGSYAVCIQYQSNTEVEDWVRSLCKHIAEYESLMRTNYSICVHSGVYFIRPNESLSVKEMIDRALIALKLCFGFEKQCIIFEKSMRDKLLLEAEIIKSMDYAIEHDEFKIYLQPQHHLQQDDVVLSAEALVRWVKSDGRIIHPGEFIPAFEKNGLISKLDRHVMELACRFIGEHMAEPWCGNISIAVNVSKVDLRQNDFIRFYTDMKNKYHIPDGLIEIEFTESAVFEDYDEFKIIMSELHRNGFSTALDDFGAGSSSLNVLKELPVDVLKMDRLFFTRDESYDRKRDNSVIASVVAMARGLGMKIIAEGIESVEQIDFLRKIGCDVIQGYVYSKPLPVEDFIEYVKNYKPRFITKPAVLRGVKGVPKMPENPEELYERYQIALEYVNAFVAEVDLEDDLVRIIGFGDETIPEFTDANNYSVIFDEIVSFLVLPDDREALINKCSLSNLLAAFYRGDDRVYCECRSRVTDPDSGVLTDRYEWFEVEVRFSHFSDEKSATAIVFVRNIHKKKARELLYVQQERRLYDLISDIYITVLEINPKEDICRVIKDSDDADFVYLKEQIDGTYHELMELIFTEGIIHVDDYQALHSLLEPESLLVTLNEEDEFRVEYRLKTMRGYAWREARIIRKGDNGDALCCIQDIDRKKRDKYQLADRIIFDRLTKTYNKDGFMELMSQYLQNEGQGGQHALLLVDIDSFREINQKHGHAFGDILLCDFVQCMRRINRKDDVIARISGDEFAIFFKDITEENMLIKAERIRKLFQTQKKQEEYDVTFCIGAAFYPLHAMDIRELYRAAFLALTEAKSNGKDSYCAFTPELMDARNYYDGGEALAVANRPFSVQVFANIFRLMYESKDIHHATSEILKFVGIQYGLSVTFIEEYSIETQAWKELCTWYSSDALLDKGMKEAIIDCYKTFAKALEQGELFSCNDVDMLCADIAGVLKQAGITAVLLAPMIYESSLCGMVGFVESTGPRVWMEDQQEALVFMADMLTAFIHTAESQKAEHCQVTCEEQLPE